MWSIFQIEALGWSFGSSKNTLSNCRKNIRFTRGTRKSPQQTCIWSQIEYTSIYWKLIVHWYISLFLSTNNIFSNHGCCRYLTKYVQIHHFDTSTPFASHHILNFGFALRDMQNLPEQHRIEQQQLCFLQRRQFPQNWIFKNLFQKAVNSKVGPLGIQIAGWRKHKMCWTTKMLWDMVNDPTYLNIWPWIHGRPKRQTLIQFVRMKLTIGWRFLHVSILYPMTPDSRESDIRLLPEFNLLQIQERISKLLQWLQMRWYLS